MKWPKLLSKCAGSRLIDVEKKQSTVREATRWLPDISRGLKKIRSPLSEGQSA